MAWSKWFSVGVLALALLGCNKSTGGGDAGVPELGGSGADLGGSPDLVAEPSASVLRHHRNLSRDGLYVVPGLSRTKAMGLHADATFTAALMGPTYGQPLFLENGAGGKDTLFVATEQNLVYAFAAADGTQLWRQSLGAPVARANLPCGNIDPLGVTGTPVIDPASRTLFVAAMTTPDGGATIQQKIFALSVEDGTVRKAPAGWPVDLNASVSANGVSFDSTVQNQRGAIAVVGGTLYVAYGGHFGDCGDFHGWLVGVPLANPAAPVGWATRARGGGIWGPSGVASDGTNVFIATGNTSGANGWQDGEAVIRFQSGPAFSGQTADYFAPTNWQQLDGSDSDIGGTSPILVDVPGATPSRLAVALGKDGKAYLIDRDRLGGIGAPLAVKHVSSSEIIGAAAAYRTAQGTYVAFRGSGAGCPSGGGDLVALRIGAAAPPTIDVAWCASENGMGSPMVTTTDGQAEAIVWAVGAEGDGRLRGFDGDTGQVVFAGGGAAEHLGAVRRYITPIAAKGRIFVAADDKLVAFTTN